MKATTDLGNSLNWFRHADYFVLALTLLLSFLVGLCCVRKTSANVYEKFSTSENVPRGSFEIVSVALSLIASSCSAIFILGISSEFYFYGNQLINILLAPPVMGIFVCFVVIPVFRDVKVVGTAEVCCSASMIY